MTGLCPLDGGPPLLVSQEDNVKRSSLVGSPPASILEVVLGRRRLPLASALSLGQDLVLANLNDWQNYKALSFAMYVSKQVVAQLCWCLSVLVDLNTAIDFLR